MAKQATIGEVCAILDHDRTCKTWVLSAGLDSNGKPCIVTIARIAVQWPRDGAGRLRVAVTDWGADGEQPAAQFVGYASGYGYDKRTAAMDGATVGGFRLGDHCDRDGCPTLDRLCNREGWRTFQG